MTRKAFLRKTALGMALALVIGSLSMPMTARATEGTDPTPAVEETVPGAEEGSGSEEGTPGEGAGEAASAADAEVDAPADGVGGVEDTVSGDPAQDEGTGTDVAEYNDPAGITGTGDIVANYTFVATGENFTTVVNIYDRDKWVKDIYNHVIRFDTYTASDDYTYKWTAWYWDYEKGETITKSDPSMDCGYRDGDERGSWFNYTFTPAEQKFDWHVKCEVLSGETVVASSKTAFIRFASDSADTFRIDDICASYSFEVTGNEIFNTVEDITDFDTWVRDINGYVLLLETNGVRDDYTFKWTASYTDSDGKVVSKTDPSMHVAAGGAGNRSSWFNYSFTPEDQDHDWTVKCEIYSGSTLLATSKEASVKFIKKNLIIQKDLLQAYNFKANTYSEGPDGQEIPMEFRVKGNVETYTWEQSNDGENGWKKVGTNSSTFSSRIIKDYHGKFFRCTATAANGDKVVSNVARVDVFLGHITYDANRGKMVDGDGTISYMRGYPIWPDPGYREVMAKGTGEGEINITRENHDFVGWFTAPTGGTQVAPGTKIKSDTVLYARWTSSAAPEIEEDLYGSYAFKAGTSIQMEVSTKNDGEYTYQWQYYPKAKWDVSGNSASPEDGWTKIGTNSPNLKIAASKTYNEAHFRCIITDTNGNSAVSRSAYVRLYNGFWSLSAVGGYIDTRETGMYDDGYIFDKWTLPEREVISDDPDLEFRGWYTAPTGGKLVPVGTVFTKDVTLYAQWRSKVSPEITVSADKTEYYSDDDVTFTAVTTAGEPVKYNWEYQVAGTTAWKAYSKGKDKSSFTVKLTKTAYKGGVTFRCTASDSEGREDTDTIELTRVTQPVTNVTVSSPAGDAGDAYYLTGQPLTLTATATGGSKFKYEWYFKPAVEGSQWTLCSGGKKQTLKITKMTDAYVGASFKCKVTNEDDGWKESEPVIPVHKKVEVTGTPTITSSIGYKGTDGNGNGRILYTKDTPLTLTVDADITNADLALKSIKYEWRYLPKGADPVKGWKVMSGGKNGELIVKKMNKTYHEALIKCIVTTLDDREESAPVYTEMAVAKITAASVSPAVDGNNVFEYTSGSPVTFSVYDVVTKIEDEVVTDKPVKKYTWEYQKVTNGQYSGWKKCSGGNKAEFSMALDSTFDGAMFRCILDNGDDNPKSTEDLGIHLIAGFKSFSDVMESFTVIVEPDTDYNESEQTLGYKLNEQRKFKAVVTPAPTSPKTSYTWKYLPAGKDPDVEGNWKSISGGTKQTLSLVMKNIYDGAQIRCTVRIPGEPQLNSVPITTTWSNKTPITDITVTGDGLKDYTDGRTSKYFMYEKGDKKTFIVSAQSGKSMKYTWMYSTDRGNTWQKCKNGTSATLKDYKLDSSMVWLKCVITNGETTVDSPILEGSVPPAVPPAPVMP